MTHLKKMIPSLINNDTNKKREHKALLFKLEIKVNNYGELLFDTNYIAPQKINKALEDGDYKYILSSIVGHCLSNSLKLEDEVRYLINKL